MNTSLYSKTPVIAVLDNRGLSVREIQYHRHPDTPDTTDERITGHQYDELGFLARSADPRLHALSQADNSVRANFTYLYSLAGEAVRTESVDAGITEAVSDAAGRPFLAVAGIGRDSNGAEERSQAVTRTFQYENAELPGRPLSITEQSAGEAARITERFAYAGNTQAEKDLNLAGQRVRHYDTAGVVQTESVAPLRVTRQLLKDEAVADWQGADASVWNDLLAPELFTTQSMADATGAVLTTTDAKGNVQRLAYDVAGLLSGSWLTLKGAAEQVIVASLTYSAAGQKLREAHGNGVVTTYTYDPETQRLTGIRTERPAGHAAGAKVLQDLRYEYDPVGNVLGIKNDAEETRFWRNQKVVPENAYVYDSLYQLVSASGRERADIAQQGASLPSPVTPLASGDGAFTSYTRTYAYDSGGNLTQMRHGAPASGNGYTTRITVSSRSNRAVLSTLTENPAEVDALFTAGGQQKQLQPGQGLTWTPRGELLQVTPVVRDGATDDGERYRYDAGSQRILKVSTQKTNTSTQAQRVLYLPGLELRTTTGGTTEKEHLHVISVGEAGRAQVRVLHWESGKPDGISNDLLRYSYDNLLGSSGLEVDGSGNIISLEEYYPYGGTAVWTARSAVEADYKTVRYSGKERDATGLYYYGYRYYQPWACRWLSADPAGTVDGLNLYRMVRNNPVMYVDEYGMASKNRFSNIFRLATFGTRRTGEGMGESLSRGMKITRGIMGGLAIAGIALSIVATAGASLGVIAAVGIGAFAVGAVAGWNISKITKSVAAFFSRKFQGKSTIANAMAGSALSSSTAHLHGARIQGTAIAGIAGMISGGAGGLLENSDRGMGGAHAAGVAVGTVDTVAGGDVSYAMEVTSATFGAIGGFITGVRGSTSVGENAGYGSYIGGMTGRYADNAVSYTFNVIGGAVMRRGAEALFAHYAGNNFISRFIGRRLGNAAFSFLSQSTSVGGANEWTGSAVGAGMGAIGTALQISAPDQHFRTRVSQGASLINRAGGYIMDLVSRYVLPAAARNVATDAVTGTLRGLVRRVAL